MLQPIEPSAELLTRFFAPSLLATKKYSIDVIDVPNKLDQNEVPYDWPEETKARVLAKLAKMPWNRYPSAFADDVTEKLAAYAGVPAECVLTSPGTNLMIALFMGVLSRAMRGRMIIARPSFPLYESQCAVEGLSYEVWPLTETLDYDLRLLPQVPSGSLIIFASPNNPVGNTLAKADLDRMLREHKDSLIIADEAYFEFADEVYTDLLAKYANLVIVRTCSKTLGAAGLRLGYSLASKAITAELKKARLPFLLNHFTIAAAGEFLEPRFIETVVAQRVSDLRRERARVYAALQELAVQKGFFVKPSMANFFLVRWPTQERCLAAYQGLIKQGILVRNISGGRGLSGCLRISLGTTAQDDAMLRAAAQCF